MNMAQTSVQEEAAVRVEAMALSAINVQNAALAKLLESTQVITDPNLGNTVDFSA